MMHKKRVQRLLRSEEKPDRPPLPGKLQRLLAQRKPKSSPLVVPQPSKNCSFSRCGERPLVKSFIKSNRQATIAHTVPKTIPMNSIKWRELKRLKPAVVKIALQIEASRYVGKYLQIAIIRL